MKVTEVLGAAMLLMAGASSALAGELNSGIPIGGKVPAYKATKCGGGDDGVQVGKSLCFT